PGLSAGVAAESAVTCTVGTVPPDRKGLVDSQPSAPKVRVNRVNGVPFAVGDRSSSVPTSRVRIGTGTVTGEGTAASAFRRRAGARGRATVRRAAICSVVLGVSVVTGAVAPFWLEMSAAATKAHAPGAHCQPRRATSNCTIACRPGSQYAGASPTGSVGV